MAISPREGPRTILQLEGGYFGVNQFSISFGRGYYFFLQNPPFLDILVIRHIFKKGALSTQQSKVVCIVKFITSAINQGGFEYMPTEGIADISANF